MKRKKRQRRPGPSPAHRQELSRGELSGIVERAKTGPLSEADYATLKAAVETLAFLTRELEAKGTTLERLRRWLFGASTEKTSHVVGEAARAAAADTPAGTAAPGDAAATPPAPKPKAPGHGRNGAAAYRGATRVKVPHPSLHTGDGCPGCLKGKVYPLQDPAVLVRILGMAPLAANIYECDRLRCNLCGEVFPAPAPPGVGDEKYDATATGMVGLLKYGTGLPFNRLEKLERGMGIPLPAATQWELVAGAAPLLAPAHTELINQAAQGTVLYNDGAGYSAGGDATVTYFPGTSDESVIDYVYGAGASARIATPPGP